MEAIAEMSGCSKPKSMIKCIVKPTGLVVFFLISMMGLNSGFCTETEQSPWFKALSPIEETEVISKFPEMIIEILQPIHQDSLVFLVDGTDVTQLITWTEKGFSYKPLMVLSSGDHTCSLSASSETGEELEGTFSFQSRHYESFEEAATINGVSVTYVEKAVENPSDQETIDSKLEANIQTQNKIIKDVWQFSVNSNFRYYNERGGMSKKAPLDNYDGFSFSEFVLSGAYDNDVMFYQFNLGDVELDQSESTLSYLSRKGVTFMAETGPLAVCLFQMRSDEEYGFAGYNFMGSDNSLFGVSGELSLLNQSLILKTVYATGQETITSFTFDDHKQSFGYSASETAQKGDIFGVMVETDFWDTLLTTECEFNVSTYDPDRNDGRSGVSDNALRFQVGSEYDRYSIEALYEYFGKDYRVIGNQFVEQDSAGFTLTGDIDYDEHVFMLVIQQLNDNVTDDDMFPKNVQTQGTIDYSYSLNPDWPLGITYEKSIIETKEPPAFSTEVYTGNLEQDIDTYSLNLNHVADKVNYSFMGTFSMNDDRSETNSDSSTYTFSITPSYIIDTFTFTPSVTLNRVKTPPLDSKIGTRVMDTFLFTILVNSMIWGDFLSFDLGGTVMAIRTNDDSSESENFNGHFRIAVNLDKYLPRFVKPVLAIKGEYTSVHNTITSSNPIFTDGENETLDKTDEFRLYFVFGVSLPVSL